MHLRLPNMQVDTFSIYVDMYLLVSQALNLYIHISVTHLLKVVDMGKILVALDDELEKRFREGVFRRYGMKKGNLTNAISEAIELWLKSK
jgi:hypothetical protein